MRRGRGMGEPGGGGGAPIMGRRGTAAAVGAAGQLGQASEEIGYG